jgi:predicted DNA-binding transcriptional regulator YafY
VTIIIIHAIDNKRLLRFTYRGYARVVEPHTYGIHKKTLRALVAFQVRGGSNSGQPEGWKTFNESEIRALSMLEETFAAPRPDYRKNDPFFESIIAQL